MGRRGDAGTRGDGRAFALSPRLRVPVSPCPRVTRPASPYRQALELAFEEGAFGGAAGAGKGALVGVGGALVVARLFP